MCTSCWPRWTSAQRGTTATRVTKPQTLPLIRKSLSNSVLRIRLAKAEAALDAQVSTESLGHASKLLNLLCPGSQTPTGYKHVIVNTCFVERIRSRLPGADGASPTTLPPVLSFSQLKLLQCLPRCRLRLSISILRLWHQRRRRQLCLDSLH